MNFTLKSASVLISTFIVILLIVIVCSFVFKKSSIDFNVVIAADCLFFLISLVVFRMQFLALYNKNPNVFIRSVMSGTIIKVFACLAAVVGYYFASGSLFNKPAVYISMVIYFIFLVVEVSAIMKLNKTKNA